MFTSAQLKKLFPGAKADLVNAVVKGWPEAQAAGITTVHRIALFLANIGVETGGLKSLSESLTYTSAARIRAVWPSRFKTEAAAKPYVRQPEKLANLVYGSRLGNTQPGDGWLYRGAGMMQTTGRENFAALGFEHNPAALRDPDTAFSTAVKEWAKRGCNALADAGDVVGCRKRINGGTNGLVEVKAYYAKALSIFASADPSVVPVPAARSKPLPIAAAPEAGLVEKVQQLLRDRGYPEVGNADGDMGSRTRNAILAFEADNSLPLTGAIDDGLLAELIKAPQREVSQERATATAKDLKDAPSVQAGDALKKLGTGVIAATGLGTVVEGAADFDQVLDSVNKVRALTAVVTSLSPWLVGLAIGGAVLYFGVKIVREQVQAYREGRHV